MKSLLTRIVNKQKTAAALREKKRDELETLKNEAKEFLTETRPSRKKSLNDSNIFDDECIFCKKPKYVKRKIEKLRQCCETRVVKTITTAANLRNDHEMMGTVTNDLIAVEAKYHPSCYALYTRTCY